MSSDLTLQQWLVYAGMVIGGVIAGLVGVRSWRAAPKADTSKDLIVSGQAAFTDMAPIKELLKQVDLLCLKIMAAAVSIDSASAAQRETAEAVSEVAHLIKQYLETRKRDEEIEAEVERRLQVKRDRAIRSRMTRKTGTDSQS